MTIHLHWWLFPLLTGIIAALCFFPYRVRGWTSMEDEIARGLLGVIALICTLAFLAGHYL